jgi:rod shape-determining protein MreD
MMKRAAVGMAVLALQWAVVSRASVGCATPDLPLAFALYLGLYAHAGEGSRRREGDFPVWTLWGLGLAIDLLGSYPTGLHSLAFLGLGWVSARISTRFQPDASWVRLIILVAGAVALRVVQLGALAAEGAVPPASKAMHFVGTSAGLTAIVGFLAFLAFDRVFRPEEGVDFIPDSQEVPGIFRA